MTRTGKPSGISPAGVAYFYAPACLHGFSLVLWEDGHPDTRPVAAYLREGGASVRLIGIDAAAGPVALPPLSRRGIRVAPPVVTGSFVIDAGVLNLRRPEPVADQLQAAGIPFVIFTENPERCLRHYPEGSCVDVEHGPEELASAILLHIALSRAGLECSPGMEVLDMVPRLRAMARFLVQNESLADDLVAQAMEEAIAFAPHLKAESEVGALLVMLLERIWRRQKTSRLM